MLRRLLRLAAASRIIQHHVFGTIVLGELRRVYSTGLTCRCSVGTPRRVKGAVRFQWRSMTLTIVEEARSLLSHTELLSFIRSSLSEAEGPNHRWLNYRDASRKLSSHADRVNLVFLYGRGELSSRCRELTFAFETMKLIQQRCPLVNVFSVQCGTPVCSLADQTQILQTIMREYVTFPVLISEEDFSHIAGDAGFLLFKDGSEHTLCFNCNADVDAITKGLEGIGVVKPESDKTKSVDDSNVGWAKDPEIIKEPNVGSLQNLLLNYPGCISVDEYGNRIFISDSNHHRIIITDAKGKILDCIGSSPGFEDGEFESAKLQRPAASYYDPDEDCLYVADSENHAIRKAHLESRVLETLYPVPAQKSTGIWSWILDRLGLAKESSEPLEPHIDAITFPWHLMKSEMQDLLIMKRHFEACWIVDMATGNIKEVIQGSSEVVASYRHLILERASLAEGISTTLQSCEQSVSVEGLPNAGLVSSLSMLQNYMFFCDIASQKILKCHQDSMEISCVEFSNFGVLGMPYWLTCPLERVYPSGRWKEWKEHFRKITVLPGRCTIRVQVDVPAGTELASPLEETSIWRQARGSACNISQSAGTAASDSDMVGIAQQWYDEIDNLAFTRPDEESEDPGALPDAGFHHRSSTQIVSVVRISPGTGEIVISAVLYLKICSGSSANIEEPKSIASRILEVPNEDAGLQLLLRTPEGRDLNNTVFTKPLHLRVRLECGDHPPGVTSNETIFLDSSVDLAVAL